MSDEPDGISHCIGTRGALTRQAAKAAARAWKDMLQRAPKAYVMLHIAGYDDDPRAVWEFDEVRKFVQQFARFAGINDVMDYSERLSELSMAFLAACGVPCSTEVRVPPKTTEH
jgi:hypothetical protein